MALPDNPQTESHHLLPSGNWEGFYHYYFDRHKHHKRLIIDFTNGIMEGTGADDIGHFSWSGIYDLNTLTCSALKIYGTHRVTYEGHIDENGIWGLWQIDPFSRGGFHIWPNTNTIEAREAIKETTALELAEPKLYFIP